MPNRNYVAGRAKEYQIMKLLRDVGFTCCRAAGSHGCFDIIAWKKDALRFIQSKKTPEFKLSLYATDIKQMKEEAVPASTDLVKVSKELWISVDRKGWEIHLVD